MQNNWNQFLKIIQESITNQSFQTWFAKLKHVQSDEEKIIIEVPNRFHYEWLDSKYEKIINDAIQKAFKKKYSSQMY